MLVGLLPRWHSGKESACQCRRPKRCVFNPWVGKIPWRRKWQPALVFLPGKSHRQRNLVGYSPRGSKESTRLSDFTFTLTYTYTSYYVLGILKCFNVLTDLILTVSLFKCFSYSLCQYILSTLLRYNSCAVIF